MLYLIAFFVHMVGVVNLFGGFILLNQAGVQYRRAATWEAARSFLSRVFQRDRMQERGSCYSKKRPASGCKFVSSSAAIKAIRRD